MSLRNSRESSIPQVKPDPRFLSPEDVTEGLRRREADDTARISIEIAQSAESDSEEDSVDCALQTEAKCDELASSGVKCRSIHASIYQSAPGCYLPAEFISCEPIDGRCGRRPIRSTKRRSNHEGEAAPVEQPPCAEI